MLVRIDRPPQNCAATPIKGTSYPWGFHRVNGLYCPILQTFYVIVRAHITVKIFCSRKPAKPVFFSGTSVERHNENPNTQHPTQQNNSTARRTTHQTHNQYCIHTAAATPAWGLRPQTPMDRTTLRSVLV